MTDLMTSIGYGVIITIIGFIVYIYVASFFDKSNELTEEREEEIEEARKRIVSSFEIKHTIENNKPVYVLLGWKAENEYSGFSFEKIASCETEQEARRLAEHSIKEKIEFEVNEGEKK